jgi:hypothetical protein
LVTRGEDHLSELPSDWLSNELQGARLSPLVDYILKREPSPDRVSELTARNIVGTIQTLDITGDSDAYLLAANLGLQMGLLASQRDVDRQLLTLVAKAKTVLNAAPSETANRTLHRILVVELIRGYLTCHRVLVDEPPHVDERDQHFRALKLNAQQISEALGVIGRTVDYVADSELHFFSEQIRLLKSKNFNPPAYFSKDVPYFLQTAGLSKRLIDQIIPQSASGAHPSTDIWTY